MCWKECWCCWYIVKGRRGMAYDKVRGDVNQIIKDLRCLEGHWKEWEFKWHHTIYILQLVFTVNIVLWVTFSYTDFKYKGIILKSHSLFVPFLSYRMLLFFYHTKNIQLCFLAVTLFLSQALYIHFLLYHSPNPVFFSFIPLTCLLQVMNYLTSKSSPLWYIQCIDNCLLHEAQFFQTSVSLLF